MLYRNLGILKLGKLQNIFQEILKKIFFFSNFYIFITALLWQVSTFERNI